MHCAEVYPQKCTHNNNNMHSAVQIRSKVQVNMAPVWERKSDSELNHIRTSVQQEINAAVQNESSVSNPLPLYIGIGCGAFALVCLFLLVCCICCLCMCYKKRRKNYKYSEVPVEEHSEVREQPKKKRRKNEKYTEIPMEEIPAEAREQPSAAVSKKEEKALKKKRDAARIEQESLERGAAKELTSLFSQEREEEFTLDERGLPEIGSRLQKHWFRGHYRDTTDILVTEAPLTKQCSLLLNRETLDTINRKLLISLRKHPYIHPIINIHYDSQVKKVLIVQPFVSRGSLRDYIFQESPLNDWSRKYLKPGVALSLDQLTLFGSQILDAMSYLYREGFTTLGHVHSGNIYVLSDSHCVVGGYENTLLGYRTKSYKRCVEQKCLEHMDKIMFGHIVYEMGSGRELKDTLFPRDRDYEALDQKHRETVQQAVQFIFEPRNSFSSIISYWKKTFSLETHTEVSVSDSQKVRRLLDSVATGGVVRQEEGGSATEHSTRSLVQEKVVGYLERSPTYQLVQHLPDIGRRLWKYWSKVKTEGKGKRKAKLLSISSVSDKQFSSSNEKPLQQFFTQMKHPYLHQPEEVQCVKEKKRVHVLFVQELVEKGSLRDRIQTTRNPLANWTVKLQNKGSPLSADKIALYGKQILEAMSFLYEQGFPPLGHVHTGNMFLKTDEEGREVCCLGGHENTLLGYETCERAFAHSEYSEAIDIKMFGHAMYEMSTGLELHKEVPVVSDYDLISRGNRERLQEIMTFVFNTSDDVSSGSVSHKDAVKMIWEHKFFSNIQLKPREKPSDSSVRRLLENLKPMFDKVSSKRKRRGGVKKVLKRLGTAVLAS